MKVLVLLSQKGGSGKSTIATHLAVAAKRQGQAVTLLDLDQQGSAAKWSQRRGGGSPPVAVGLANRATSLVQKAKDSGSDLVIVDTAGHADAGNLHILQLADLILIPCRPSAADLDAIEQTISLCQFATHSKSAVILNAAPVQGSLAEQAREAIAERIAVCPVVLHQRQAYSRAWIDGRSVEELDKSSRAAEEIRGLWRWCKGQLDASKTVFHTDMTT